MICLTRISSIPSHRTAWACRNHRRAPEFRFASPAVQWSWVNRSASMPINKFLYFGDFVAIPCRDPCVLVYFALSQSGFGRAPDLAISLLIGDRALDVGRIPDPPLRLSSRAGISRRCTTPHHREPEALIGVPSFVPSGFYRRRLLFPARDLRSDRRGRLRPAGCCSATRPTCSSITRRTTEDRAGRLAL